jgi:cysteine-rich repeat protein
MRATLMNAARIFWRCVVTACVAGAPACGTTSGGTADEGESYDVTDQRDADGGDTGQDDAAEADGAPDDATHDTPPELLCGNGVVDPAEECDDGNRMNGDDCDWECRAGPGTPPPDGTPDPAAGHLELDGTPVALDIGTDRPELADNIFAMRIPLVWTGAEFASVWPHWQSAAAGAPLIGTFFRFGVDGGRHDAPWSYVFDYGDTAAWAPTYDLVWDGSRFGLVWAGRIGEPPCGDDMQALLLLLDWDGKPLGDPMVISEWALRMKRIGITWDLDGFAVLKDAGGCEGDMEVDLVPLSNAGALRAPPIRMADGTGKGVGALAWSGRAYVTAWRSEDAGAMAMLSVASPDGVGLDRPVGLGEIVGGSASPDVDWCGDEFAVAWPGREPDSGPMARCSPRRGQLADWIRRSPFRPRSPLLAVTPAPWSRGRRPAASSRRG